MLRRRVAVFAFTMVVLAMFTSAPPNQAVASTTTADWLEVDAGSTHSCAIKTNYSLWCWGDNSEGQIGNGDPQGQICIGGASSFCRDKTKKQWVKVSAGNNYTCGIERTTQKLYCWGKNNYGQLGHATSSVPVEVTGGGKWSAVVAGDTHTCAIKTDKTLWCWGRDDKGQLGNDSLYSNKTSPTRVSTAIATMWVDVDVESKQSCAVATTYVMYCWGQWGWVGTVGGSNNPTPTRVQSGDISHFTDWRSVSTGRYHICGIRASGALYCFGKNNVGQVGNGTGVDVRYPVQVNAGVNWLSVDLGLDFTCGIRSNGQLWCWGDNYFGQPGQICGSQWVSAGPRMCDVFTPAYPSPVREATKSTAAWTKIDAGGFHSCSIKSSKRLFCWGQDTKAQLGFRYISPMPGGICTYVGYWDWDPKLLGPSDCILYSPPNKEVENQ